MVPGETESAPFSSESDDDLGLAELLPQYFALCLRDLHDLRTALTNEQFDRIRVLGHNLKGSGGAYGFPDLSSIGSHIEESAQERDQPEIQAGIERLASFLQSQQIPT